MRVPTCIVTGRGIVDKPGPTFTDMLGALRLQMWEYEVFGEAGDEVPSPECIRKLLNTLSAVG